MRIALGVIVGCTLIGCAGTGSEPVGDAGGPGSNVPPVAGTLSISTPTTDLLLAPDPAAAGQLAATAAFTAMVTASDGTMTDVTAQTRFIAGNYGQFTGNQLRMTVAAKIQVIATYSDRSATAEITTRAVLVRVDPSVPASLAGNVASLFADAMHDNAQIAPQIIYPSASAIMPRNIGSFEIHWTDGSGNNLFEASLHTDLTDVRVYLAGGNGLATAGPMASYAVFTPDEWAGALSVETTVNYQVRGIDTNAENPAIGGAQPTALQLSNEPLDGILYYWATESSSTATGIFRYDMATPKLAVAPFLTTDQTGGRCVACHVLSRDGTKMAVTYQDTGATAPGAATFVNTTTRVPATSAAQWNFGTFSKDDTQFLAVEDGVLVVRDANTQQLITTMTTTPAKTAVTQPDLSPDGTVLVYVRPGLAGSDFDFKLGQIWIRSYDAATHSFGAETQLVNDGSNNFFPSWSPDGQWIAFNRTDAADHSYDDNNTSAWVVKADGSAPPIALAAANQARGLTNSAVRWAPFATTLGSPGQQTFWLTMSSKRDFGARMSNAGLAQRGAGGKLAQLWMTPFFPALAAKGSDPSLPAFRLPYPDLKTSVQTAQWTEPQGTID